IHPKHKASLNPIITQGKSSYVMFWGCFSYYGIGSLHPVEGMMRSPQYIEILRRKVAPELIKLFPDGSGVFQQDLAPCHTSKQVKNFFEENQINTLDWPGNSPDLNPIENLLKFLPIPPCKTARAQ
uniref:Tc1-like transposase DDE domain-containing protein n=1 Tax=Monopterus albus TaxID=43700 RepID=A0A3Q3QW79_MONAL